VPVESHCPVARQPAHYPG